MRIKLSPKIFLLFVLPICVFLTFNKHSKDKANTYNEVIWADAAGYYVYEPMWFIYGNNANKFPTHSDIKTGNGFQLDLVNNNVFTKYYCGTAILESPFFIISHILSKPFGFKDDGFSKIYSYGLYFSGIFYCCLGLFFLSKFLNRHFSSLISFVIPFIFLVGSNLYFYTIDAPGMSHVYSFFLFSAIIYLTPFLIQNPQFKYYLLFFCLSILIVLTRPTNIFICLFPLFYDMNDKGDFILRIRHLFNDKLLILLTALLSLIIAIPQLLYWNRVSGDYFIYSYKNETFSFLKKPKLLEVWFSTNNGLFTYTPIILICLIGVGLMIKQKKWLGFYIGILFFVISYIFASWWNWWFGCAFGARSFVEYYAVFCIPFAYLFAYLFNYKFFKYIVVLFVIICCYLNMDMEYYYDGCFYGDTWDISTYFKLLNS